MNLTAPVNLLALLLASNNQSSNLKPDDGLVEQYGLVRCYDCGAFITENTWCNNPTEQNAPQDGIKNCYHDLCTKTVFSNSERRKVANYTQTPRTVSNFRPSSHISNLETVIERRCGIEGLCHILEMEEDIRVESCVTCAGHLCNEGARLYQSSWLLTTIICTSIAKLSISIFMSK